MTALQVVIGSRPGSVPATGRIGQRCWQKRRALSGIGWSIRMPVMQSPEDSCTSVCFGNAGERLRGRFAASQDPCRIREIGSVYTEINTRRG